jgi:hypothetical protein
LLAHARCLPSGALVPRRSDWRHCSEPRACSGTCSSTQKVVLRAERPSRLAQGRGQATSGWRALLKTAGVCGRRTAIGWRPNDSRATRLLPRTPTAVPAGTPFAGPAVGSVAMSVAPSPPKPLRKPRCPTLVLSE